MIVAMVIGFTFGTDGEILLTVVGYNPVNQAIVAKAIQDSVDGGAVGLGGDLLLDHFVAQGGFSFL